MTYDDFVSRLENVRRNPDGSVTAKCPAHDDRVSSLSARPGDRVNVIAYCHRGCDFRSIVRAIEFAAGRGVSRG